jgi:hypothetical protein
MNDRERLRVAVDAKNWEEAKTIIRKNPLLIFEGINSCVRFAIVHENLDFLAYLMDIVCSHWWCIDGEKSRENRQKILHRESEFEPLACSAARNACVQSLAFLVENSPDGASILQSKGWYMPVTHACFHGGTDTLDYILRNSSKGTSLLDVKNQYGNTVADVAFRPDQKRYIQKILDNRVVLSTSC